MERCLRSLLGTPKPKGSDDLAPDDPPWPDVKVVAIVNKRSGDRLAGKLAEWLVSIVSFFHCSRATTLRFPHPRARGGSGINESTVQRCFPNRRCVLSHYPMRLCYARERWALAVGTAARSKARRGERGEETDVLSCLGSRGSYEIKEKCGTVSITRCGNFTHPLETEPLLTRTMHAYS